MKLILSLLLTMMATSSFAVSEDWSSISCRESAARHLQDSAFVRGDYVKRINLYNEDGEVEMEISRQYGRRSTRKGFVEIDSDQDGYKLYENKKFIIEVGIVGSVKTEVKIYSRKTDKLLAYLLCNSSR